MKDCIINGQIPTFLIVKSQSFMYFGSSNIMYKPYEKRNHPYSEYIKLLYTLDSKKHSYKANLVR